MLRTSAGYNCGSGYGYDCGYGSGYGNSVCLRFS